MDLGEDPGTRADALTDGLAARRERSEAVPSTAFPGFPPEPVRQVHDLPVDLPHGARVERPGPSVTRPESPRRSGIQLTVTPGDTVTAFPALPAFPAFPRECAAAYGTRASGSPV